MTDEVAAGHPAAGKGCALHTADGARFPPSCSLPCSEAEYRERIASEVGFCIGAQVRMAAACCLLVAGCMAPRPVRTHERLALLPGCIGCLLHATGAVQGGPSRSSLACPPIPHLHPLACAAGGAGCGCAGARRGRVSRPCCCAAGPVHASAIAEQRQRATEQLFEQLDANQASLDKGCRRQWLGHP